MNRTRLYFANFKFLVHIYGTLKQQMRSASIAHFRLGRWIMLFQSLPKVNDFSSPHVLMPSLATKMDCQHQDAMSLTGCKAAYEYIDDMCVIKRMINSPNTKYL